MIEIVEEVFSFFTDAESETKQFKSQHRRSLALHRRVVSINLSSRNTRGQKHTDFLGSKVTEVITELRANSIRQKTFVKVFFYDKDQNTQSHRVSHFVDVRPHVFQRPIRVDPHGSRSAVVLEHGHGLRVVRLQASH